MYAFFTKFIYNEYIRPYFVWHIVFMIFTNDPPPSTMTYHMS